jgi:hypothetical protein
MKLAQPSHSKYHVNALRIHHYEIGLEIRPQDLKVNIITPV